MRVTNTPEITLRSKHVKTLEVTLVVRSRLQQLQVFPAANSAGDEVENCIKKKI